MIPKFYPTSLRSRAVAVVLMAFMPLWALSLWSYFEQRDRAIREMQRDELVTVRYMANVQETLFNDTKQFLMTLARLPEVQRLDREACSALFAQLLKQNPSRFTIVAADAEGRLLASAPAAPGPVTYADRPWFQKVKQSRDLVLGEITIGHVSGKYGCNLAYPILDGEGPFLGALTSQLNLDWMWGLLAKSNFPPSTGLVLTDISRKIIFRYPEPEKYIGQMLPEAFIKPMTSQDEGVAEGIGLPRDERLFAFARLAPPWQELWVTIGLPREWVVTPIHRALWRNLMWLGLVTLVALAVAWYGAGWWVVSPVRELRVITDRLAAGDLRVRAGPDYRVGELGLLARDFDQMAAALQEREEALGRAYDELEQRVKERTEELRLTVEMLQEEVSERLRAEEIMQARLKMLQLAESHSLEEFPQVFLDELEALTGSTIGFYHLVEADQNTLSLQAWSTNTLRNMCTAEGKGRHYDIAEAGVWVDCVQRRKPVIHNDYAALAHRKGMPPGHAPVVRELVAPILRGDKVVAIIGMGNKPSDYDERDIEVLSTLGDLWWDIADRKRAVEGLAKLNEELEQRVKERTSELKRSNQELEEFAYVASHDLQEPLRKIANFSEMLAHQYQAQLDDQAQRYFGYITDGAKRLQTLINGLLTYSRVGRAEIAQVPASLEAILKGTLSDLQTLILESGAEISHEPLPTLEVNPHQIGQLLQNLIANAIKFHGDQPSRIHISARQEGNEWVIAIRDNGIGFDSQFAEQIFKVFKRLHTKEAYPGTGIGLAICKKIVERHGGRIWAESEPGRGSTFYFSIPV